MAEYRFSPAAQRDLDGIFDHTVKQWGLQQALRYTQAIEQMCAQLAQRPNRGHSCDHIRPGYRVASVERHKVFFRPAPYGIAVIRILHDRMDAPRHLQGVT
jgi:toxin ParE1/3/4